MKNPDKKSQPGNENVSATVRRFKLFVAGNEPNSKTARYNFEKVRSLIDAPCELEIVDVLEDFRSALALNILVTPTLLQESPAPAIMIVGNLKDIPRVLTALGVKEPVNDG